jgi:hypothetical protein
MARTVVTPNSRTRRRSPRAAQAAHGGSTARGRCRARCAWPRACVRVNESVRREAGGMVVTWTRDRRGRLRRRAGRRRRCRAGRGLDEMAGRARLGRREHRLVAVVGAQEHRQRRRAVSCLSRGSDTASSWPTQSAASRQRELCGLGPRRVPSLLAVACPSCAIIAERVPASERQRLSVRERLDRRVPLGRRGAQRPPRGVPHGPRRRDAAVQPSPRGPRDAGQAGGRAATAPIRDRCVAAA